MRKLIMSNMMSLDGYFAGTEGELDWHVADKEFDNFAARQLGEMEAILFGRVTYQMMATYWPTPEAISDDAAVAHYMNSLPKIVFSKTLDKQELANWSNSTLIRDNVEDEVRKLKQQPGGDMVIFGSANLVASLILADLIDEYRVIVNPVVLGSGKPLFRDPKTKLNLKLLHTETFKSGVTVLSYTLEKTEKKRA